MNTIRDQKLKILEKSIAEAAHVYNYDALNDFVDKA